MSYTAVSCYLPLILLFILCLNTWLQCRCWVEGTAWCRKAISQDIIALSPGGCVGTELKIISRNILEVLWKWNHSRVIIKSLYCHQESVTGVLDVVEKYSKDQSGGFLDHTGATLPWWCNKQTNYQAVGLRVWNDQIHMLENCPPLALLIGEGKYSGDISDGLLG